MPAVIWQENLSNVRLNGFYRLYSVATEAAETTTSRNLCGRLKRIRNKTVYASTESECFSECTNIETICKGVLLTAWLYKKYTHWIPTQWWIYTYLYGQTDKYRLLLFTQRSCKNHPEKKNKKKRKQSQGFVVWERKSIYSFNLHFCVQLFFPDDTQTGTYYTYIFVFNCQCESTWELLTYCHLQKDKSNGVWRFP